MHKEGSLFQRFIFENKLKFILLSPELYLYIKIIRKSRVEVSVAVQSKRFPSFLLLKGIGARVNSCQPTMGIQYCEIHL